MCIRDRGERARADEGDGDYRRDTADKRGDVETRGQREREHRHLAVFAPFVGDEGVVSPFLTPHPPLPELQPAVKRLSFLVSIVNLI